MASQGSIRRALGRHNLSALDKYLDDPLYKNRNDVILAIGLFLSNGTITVSNEEEDDRDTQQLPHEAGSGQSQRGRKSKKQQAAADEHKVEQEIVDGEAQSDAEDNADGDEELPTSAAFLSESDKAELLHLITARIHDCHAYTRSKSLQTLISLVSSRSLSPSLLFLLPPLAMDRLRDTSSAVRKYAVQLLSAACQYNPLGPELRGDKEREEIERMGQDVQRLMEDDRRRREERAKRAADKQKQTDAKPAENGEEAEMEGELEELQLLDGEENGELGTEEVEDAMEVSTFTLRSCRGSSAWRLTAAATQATLCDRSCVSVYRACRPSCGCNGATHSRGIICGLSSLCCPAGC